MCQTFQFAIRVVLHWEASHNLLRCFNQGYQPGWPPHQPHPGKRQLHHWICEERECSSRPQWSILGGCRWQSRWLRYRVCRGRRSNWQWRRLHPTKRWLRHWTCEARECNWQPHLSILTLDLDANRACDASDRESGNEGQRGSHVFLGGLRSMIIVLEDLEVEDGGGGWARSMGLYVFRGSLNTWRQLDYAIKSSDDQCRGLLVPFLSSRLERRTSERTAAVLKLGSGDWSNLTHRLFTGRRSNMDRLHQKRLSRAWNGRHRF